MAQPPAPIPPSHANVRLPPPLAYILPFLLAWLLQAFIPLPGLPIGIARVLTIALCIAGGTFCVWSIGLFRHSKTSLIPVKPTTTLVTSGPYRVTRNPMYLGLLCLYLAAACWFNIVWALVLAPIVVVVIQRIIEKEEQYLGQKFGEVYRHYQAQVRRWI